MNASNNIPLTTPNLENKDPGSTRLMLTMPDCMFDEDVMELHNTLAEHLARKPARLTIRFVGGSTVLPTDAILKFYETLQGKSPDTKLITETMSPLIHGDVLLWAAGDCRRISPTAWLYFRGPIRPPPLEEEEWCLKDPEEALSSDERNYNAILRLLDRHLPVATLADTRLTPAILGEFALLDSQPRVILFDGWPVRRPSHAATGQGKTHRTGRARPSRKLRE